MKVWSPEQLRSFVEFTRDDRLAAAWLLLVTTGMRRGEVLGLAWDDLDPLECSPCRSPQPERHQLQRRALDPAEDLQGSASIALDPSTNSALQAHRVRQLEERLRCGEAWNESDLVSTREDGTMIHPERMNGWFAQLTRDAARKRCAARR
jgi:integrase